MKKIKITILTLLMTSSILFATDNPRAIGMCKIFFSEDYIDEIGYLRVFSDLSAIVKDLDGEIRQKHNFSYFKRMLIETEDRDLCFPKRCGEGAKRFTRVQLFERGHNRFEGKILGRDHEGEVSGFVKKCHINIGQR